MEGLTRVVLSLGSNLGDRYQNLSKAVELIKERIGSIDQISKLYETPPVGFEASQDFINLCLSIYTTLSPEEFIRITQKIESEMGRIRSKKGYSSRPMDIDIIFFGSQIIENEKLSIPHPRFRDRLFVLQPLIDLDVKIIDPVTLLTAKQMIDQKIDKSSLSLYEKDISCHD